MADKMSYYEKSLKIHEEKKGKLEIISKVSVNNRDDLSTAYTPGVAEPCKKITENTEDVYKYTMKGNTVAVVSDGSAVLGLGNIGAEAGLPVMEGKAVLFKEFAGIDAMPICLKTQKVDEIVHIVKNIAPVFGGINLEDISAPRCFEIEEKLKKELDIPVFHDDQHGTAIVVSAGLINALKVVDKKLDNIKVVVNGAGSAGTAITKMLINLGIQDILVCDREGILYENKEGLNWAMTDLAKITNGEKVTGTLVDAVKGRDVFIGVSAPNILTEEMIKTMNNKPIVFAMANPEPEIMPDIAKKVGVAVMGTGRSDFPNQINNVLAFPGIFRGALDVRATAITEEMKVAAAYALAGIVTQEQLTADYILPSAFEKGIAEKIAEAVKKCWMSSIRQ